MTIKEGFGNVIYIQYVRRMRTVTAAMAGGKTRELEAAHE